MRAEDWKEAVRRAQEARGNKSRKAEEAALRECSACGKAVDHRSGSHRCPHHQLALLLGTARKPGDAPALTQTERSQGQKRKHAPNEYPGTKRRGASEWERKEYDPKPAESTPGRKEKCGKGWHASRWQTSSLVDLVDGGPVDVAKALVAHQFLPEAPPCPQNTGATRELVLDTRRDPATSAGVAWRCVRRECSSVCRSPLEPEGKRLFLGPQRGKSLSAPAHERRVELRARARQRERRDRRGDCRPECDGGFHAVGS